MIKSILVLFTSGLYFLTGGFQTTRLYSRDIVSKTTVLGGAFIAVIMHALLLYYWIDKSQGQNLALLNILSQVAWTAAFLLCLLSLVRPVDNLGAIIYPCAAITVLLVWLFPGNRIIDTSADPRALLHILLAFLVISVFCLTALQATLLALQDRLLRSRQTGGIMRALPPLETMENLLFQMISLGFVLLTIVLISSIIIFPNIFSGQLLPHSLLAIVAWIVFAILLCGHKFFGWRGRVAIRWTLIGVSLLFLMYCTIWLLGTKS
jgi:ABC-type uncharacterized transport system permease subunit